MFHKTDSGPLSIVRERQLVLMGMGTFFPEVESAHRPKSTQSGVEETQDTLASLMAPAI